MRADMGTRFRKFAAAVGKINTTKLYLEAAQENAALALDLNRLQLLAQGIDAKGKKLGSYSNFTKSIKRSKGQETEYINLYDTGDWQEALFLDTDQLPIFIDSDDWKNTKLKERFGIDITGLIPEHQEQFKVVVREAYIIKVDEVITALAKKIL